MHVYVVKHKLKSLVLGVFDTRQKASDALHGLVSRAEYDIEKFMLNHVSVFSPKAPESTE